MVAQSTVAGKNLNELGDYLEFAVDTAWRAGRLTLAHFQAGVAIERKPDGSVVTVADRSAEQLMRRRIESRFPDHSIVGEEFGSTGPLSSFQWLLDPIDGTNSFVRGVPFYGVLIALAIDQAPIVGVAYFPALDELIAAANGLGCSWNGRRAHASEISVLSEACIVYTDAQQISGRLDETWNGLLGETALQRGWGDCYGHCLVATGRADVMLDPRMHAWDCAALMPILQEAGGRFTDWRGRVTAEGGDAVSTNGILHEPVLARLAAAVNANRP